MPIPPIPILPMVMFPSHAPSAKAQAVHARPWSSPRLSASNIHAASALWGCCAGCLCAVGRVRAHRCCSIPARRCGRTPGPYTCARALRHEGWARTALILLRVLLRYLYTRTFSAGENEDGWRMGVCFVQSRRRTCVGPSEWTVSFSTGRASVWGDEGKTERREAEEWMMPGTGSDVPRAQGRVQVYRCCFQIYKTCILAFIHFARVGLGFERDATHQR